jgi:hypothetical protein
MKKIVTLLIAVIFLSCSNPMSKVYTEEGFMLDMVEIRESNGEETATKITGYIMQQAMITSFNEEAENMLVGKTYSELVKQSDDYEAQMKAKEEEEKRLAEEEKGRFTCNVSKGYGDIFSLSLNMEYKVGAISVIVGRQPAKTTTYKIVE